MIMNMDKLVKLNEDSANNAINPAAMGVMSRTPSAIQFTLALSINSSSQIINEQSGFSTWDAQLNFTVGGYVNPQLAIELLKLCKANIEQRITDMQSTIVKGEDNKSYVDI